MTISEHSGSALLRLCTIDCHRAHSSASHKGICHRMPSAPKPASLTPATGLGLGETFSAVEGNASSSESPTLLASPSSKGGLIAAKGKAVKREESHDLDMTPGLWHAFAARQLLGLEKSTCGIVRWRSARLHHFVPWRRYGGTTVRLGSWEKLVYDYTAT